MVATDACMRTSVEGGLTPSARNAPRTASCARLPACANGRASRLTSISASAAHSPLMPSSLASRAYFAESLRTSVAKSLRRAADRIVGRLEHAVADLLIGQRLAELGVEARDDVRRRAGRHEHAEPLIEHHALEARFLERRDVRQASAERVSDDCARKRKVLFSKCGIIDVGPRHAIGTCAAIRSFTAWPAPRYGTWSSLMPASLRNHSPRKCWFEPTPEVA